MKVLHGDSGSAEEAVRFTREAQLLAELRHPAIVDCVTHGQTSDGQRYLVMERDWKYRL